MNVNERIKLLAVKFLSQQLTLTVGFSVEKKRLRRSLVEQAAEVVAGMVDDADELEIPRTLRTVVSDKIIDADWVASHRWAKYKFDKQNPDIKLESVPEDYDKTVHQVVPVPRLPMMKWFLKNFVLKPLYALPRALCRLFGLFSMMRK